MIPIRRWWPLVETGYDLTLFSSSCSGLDRFNYIEFRCFLELPKNELEKGWIHAAFKA